MSGVEENVIFDEENVIFDTPHEGIAGGSKTLSKSIDTSYTPRSQNSKGS